MPALTLKPRIVFRKSLVPGSAASDADGGSKRIKLVHPRALGVPGGVAGASAREDGPLDSDEGSGSGRSGLGKGKGRLNLLLQRSSKTVSSPLASAAGDWCHQSGLCRKCLTCESLWCAVEMRCFEH